MLLSAAKFTNELAAALIAFLPSNVNTKMGFESLAY